MSLAHVILKILIVQASTIASVYDNIYIIIFANIYIIIFATIYVST